MSETMSGEHKPEPDLNSGQILDLLEDSTSDLPLILDDLHLSADTVDDPWWGQDPTNANTISSSSASSPVDHVITDQPPQLAADLSNKEIASEDHNIGSYKDRRWAEQLLNLCAEAITTGNMTRVQHLLYVLQELASPTGDANERLAGHGVQALLRHFAATTNTPATAVAPTISFTTSTPKWFKQSLIMFNEVNPWFTFPNNIANNAILHMLSEQDHGACANLHILDIGVSHGFQWPTLLETLSRRPDGPPPLVRLTVVQPTLDNHQLPFANCPPGYDFVSNILHFAKDVNIHLQINKLDNIPLQKLNAEAIGLSPDETLIICAQFRLHSLNHNEPDERSEFLKLMRSMNPHGMILSDNNMDFDSFGQRLDYLWKFLDSTSVAFKRREMVERRLLEGEAAKSLINMCETNERKEKWVERMHSVGFVKHAFADDVVDQANALLKKCDSQWEMRVEEEGGSVGFMVERATSFILFSMENRLKQE